MRYLVVFLQKLRWSIRTKIGYAFGLILLCFLVNALISILLLLNSQKIQDKQRVDLVYLERLERIKLAYQSEVDLFSDTIFINKIKYVKDRFREVIVNTLLNDEVLDSSNQIVDFERELAKNYSKALDVFITLENILVSDNFPQAETAFRQATPLFNQITQSIETREKNLRADQTSQRDSLALNQTVSIITITSFTALSIFMALFLLFLLEQVLVIPLKKLQEGLSKMAQGNLDQKIGLANRDEVGKLSDSFSSAVVAFKQVVNGVQIGESLSTITQELTVVSNQQASGASQQAATLTQITTSMEELNKSAEHIATNASQVTALMLDTTEQIEQVNQAVQNGQTRTDQMTRAVTQTMLGIEQVRYKVNEFSQLMNALKVQSGSINKVLEIIGNIASEVHLLSLNAAIEAAGAGEYGERFKVVARQVKDLAGRSNRASREVAELIQKTQTNTLLALEQTKSGQLEVENIVQASNALQQGIEELQESTKQINLALTQLVEISQAVKNATNQIKLATQQQSSAGGQIIEAVRTTQEVAKQSAQAAHQIVNNNSVLEQLTKQLNTVLGQIKLVT
jgi:methyl-accepting chemotaxis protein